MADKKFKELYVNGEIEFEDIDGYIYRWGMSDSILTLREYLGLNVEEEDAYVNESEDALRDLLEIQRKNSQAKH